MKINENFHDDILAQAENLGPEFHENAWKWNSEVLARTGWKLGAWVSWIWNSEVLAQDENQGPEFHEHDIAQGENPGPEFHEFHSGMPEMSGTGFRF